MQSLIKHIIATLDIQKLGIEESDQAIFYIDFLLEEEGNINEVITLTNLKTKIEEHLDYLKTIVPQVLSTVYLVAFNALLGTAASLGIC